MTTSSGSPREKVLRPLPENLKLPPSIDPSILDKPGKLGVAAVIHNGKGNVVMGQRAGSHGAGVYQSLFIPWVNLGACVCCIPIRASRRCIHPLLDSFGFLYHVIFLYSHALPIYIHPSSPFLTIPRLGTFQFPGGHFESSDLTIPTTAIREALEETGLVLDPATAEIIAATHDIFEEGKEYVTVFVLARVMDGAGMVPEVSELCFLLMIKGKAWDGDGGGA